MRVLFVSSVAPITPDPAASRRLYVDALALPLEGDDGYRYSERVDGVKHFGVWSLDAAAEACFGARRWPDDVPVPQASVEFEVDDVPDAAAELQAKGYRLLVEPKTESYGQTVARLLSPEGLLVGVSYTPWLR